MERIVWVVSRQCGQLVQAEFTFKCIRFSQQTCLGRFLPECLTFKGNSTSPPIKLKVLLDYSVDGAGVLCHYIIISLNMIVFLKKIKGNECFIFNQRWLWLCFQIDSNEIFFFFKSIPSLQIHKSLEGLGVSEISVRRRDLKSPPQTLWLMSSAKQGVSVYRFLLWDFPFFVPS